MPKSVMCKKCNNLVNGWCEKVIDSPDPDTVRDCQHFWEKTNADRIRAMSDEELVEFLHKKPWLCESHSLCIDCPKYHKEKGCLSTDEWLKQPAEGVE